MNRTLPAPHGIIDKIIGIGPTLEMSDDMDADMAKIRAWYAPWQGRNRGAV